MKVPSKDIFTNNEVVIVGYSKTTSHFSNHVYNEFIKAGIQAYAFNPNINSYNIKVFNRYKDINNLPDTAVVLLNRESLKLGIDDILNAGFKTIIVNNKNSVTINIEDKCREKNVELHVVCPLMIFGKGIHKFHKIINRIF